MDADRVVEALVAALDTDGDQLLDADERARIDEALGQLRSVAGEDDPDAIRKGIEHLESVCGFYVERRMNKGIHDAMAGHTVDEFKQG